MTRTLRLVLLALVLLLPAHAVAQVKSFAHSGIARDAQRYESSLKANSSPGSQKPHELVAAGRKALAAGNDQRAAVRAFARAAAIDPNNAETWMSLAGALLATAPDPARPAERYDLPANASAAAYLAYQRATAPAVKARALAVLGEALGRRSFWRPAIEALRTSLSLVENAEVRQSYETLRSEHGFRLLDYTVEQESSQPRVCLQFSESLQRGQDFAKFIAVDGNDAQAIAVEGKQLCVEGLSHGKRYQMLVRAGLPSEVAETLDRPAELAIYVRDRSPAVRFTGRSYVLPSRGQSGIPVVSINTDTVAVEIYRIGDRSLASALTNGTLQQQLSPYELEQMRLTTGARIYAGEMSVASRLNEEVTTAVPVGEAVPELKSGVYAMVARPASGRDEYGALATQWFIVSDLGLTTFSGDDGIHAFVRSLSTTGPVKDASVRLVARNNEVLGQLRTDAQGYARFEAGLSRGEGGMAPALLVAEGASGDYAFLDLTTAAFDLTDRGVEGREAPGPIDGFLFSERGVYRPGEEVHLTALTRDRAGKASGVPTTLIVARPDGVEHRHIPLTSDELGGRAATLRLPGSAMTGTWRVRLHADPKADPLASAAFLVEDFVPERLELQIDPVSAVLVPEQSGGIRIAGRYLYGAPAANLAVEGDIVVKAASGGLGQFPGYSFGLADETVSPVRKPIEGLPNTDAQGRAELSVMLPAIPRTSRPLEAQVMLRLREPGGRTIERSVALPVDLEASRIGLRPLFDGLQIGDDATAEFDVILLDRQNRRAAAKGARWELVRLEQRWQWYSRDGYWTYEAVTLTRKVAGGAVDIGSDGPARISAKVGWGRYRLEVAAPDAGGPVSSVIFTAGWYADEGADSPEMLEVALDKPTYKAGDVAKLKIAARHGGRALVAVLGEGLLASREVELPAGGGEVAIPVGSTWGPGAYVTAMLYRPLDEKEKRMPGRAIGVKWLPIDQSARTLRVGLDVAQQMRSGRSLTVPVRIGNLAAGEEARVTVAAVDLGILNLTSYKAPRPESWFFGQRRLGTEIRDFYGRLIDGMRAERGALRSGGDESGGLAMEGSPPTEATVALFSGIVKVAADGTASVAFELPEFNGTVRVMAVAWSAGKLGHATADVIVRDPVALLASGPRFLALGDEARLEIDLHNIEGVTGPLRLAVEQEAPAGALSTVLQRDVLLGANERKAERFRIKPQEVGRFAYDIKVSGAAGLEIRRRLTLDVKPPAGDIRRVTVSKLAPNGGSVTLGQDLLADLIPGLTSVSVSVGPAAGLDAPGLLAQLDRYPYGCAEQTTSRALPLLYANQLAVQSGLRQDAGLEERIEKAVERVFEMQDSSGAFGVWGPGDGDMWLTSYVTEFLTRAREQGFAVKPQAFALALDRLQNFVSYAQDFERGGEARAYALYVLARNGRAPIGEVRYWADTRLDRFATPLAKAQLAAALAMLGDRERAEAVFRQAIASMAGAEDPNRRDFGSGLRDRAALVTLAAETRTAQDDAGRLASTLAEAHSNRAYTSTQEQAWMLLAARALADQSRFTTLSVAGAPHKGAYNRTLSAAELRDGALTIRNDGDAAVDAVISVMGAALTPEPPVARNFRIERAFYTLDGKPVRLESAAGGSGRLRQTDRLVVVLKVEAEAGGGRVLVVDRLPAGLEIENPRLVDSADLKSFDWLRTTVQPEHTEFRDDRFVAAFNLSGRGDGNGQGESGNDDSKAQPAKSLTMAYMVRVVTPGTYVHPAATVEDMYRPERFARTASGRVEVSARE
ncbi:MAG: alpha-2-macroglobulin family protein [Hyphomicrobiaceae bacterium]|nr:alpha-2-macroglobulin family protein [Hyphomicrobiaceae bacterium]